MLTSKQRAKLRKLAHDMETLIQIGKGGVTPGVVEQVRETLNNKELVKGKVLENCLMDAKEAAFGLADKINCDVVFTIGSKFVLFKVSDDKDKRKIFLDRL